jgi:hypothetical protein
MITPSSPREYVDALIADAGLVELRHHDRGRWQSLWFADPHALLTAALERAGSGNLYTSLHRPKPGARSPGSTTPITNAEIERFTRIFFDFDPVRPKDTPSSAPEVQAAQERARGLARLLTAHGWPQPAIAMSGNGWHLHYRTALPNDDATSEMLRAIYASLAAELGDDVVGFDTTVRNAGRICALPGFTKRKGEPTERRPHRVARIWIPQEWKQVHPRQVEALASRYTPKREAEEARRKPQEGRMGDFAAGGMGDYGSLDVVAWFAAHGAYRFPIEGNKHSGWCPWQDAHTTEHGRTGAIIFEADDSWPGFFCHHQHCAGRDIRDVLELWGDADRYCTAEWRKGVA